MAKTVTRKASGTNNNKQQQTNNNNILLNNREKNAEINPKTQVAKANASGLKESSQQGERKKSVNYRTPRYTLSLVCMCFFGLFFFFFLNNNKPYLTTKTQKLTRNPQVAKPRN